MSQFTSVLAAILYQNKLAQDQFAQSDNDWASYYDSLNKRQAAADNAWRTGQSVEQAEASWPVQAPGSRVAPSEPATPPEMLTQRPPAPAPQSGVGAWPQAAAKTVGAGLKGIAGVASNFGKSLIPAVAGGAAPKPPKPG